MSVLSKKHILKRLQRPASSPGSLVITPLVDIANALDNDSVDLRLGSEFLLPQVPPKLYASPDRFAGGDSFHLRVHVPFGESLVVPAHETVLGATLEFIKVPYDVSGQILTKSSVARTFIVIETAPWVHPYYRGCLTLEIANVSNTPQLLYPGERIGQLVLFRVDGAVRPRKVQGQYIGPIRPEAPKMKPIAEELKPLGVKVAQPRPWNS